MKGVIKLGFLLSTSLITATTCVNSAEKGLGITAFAARSVVAGKMHCHAGVSALTEDRCFEAL